MILIRPRDSPWYTCELRRMKRKLIRLYHIAKEKMSEFHWNKYKEFNRKYHECLNQAEANYRQNMCDSLNEQRNTKGWWRTVKHILGRGNDQNYPSMLNENNQQYVTSSKDKAVLFNNYFLSHSSIDDSDANLPDNNIGIHIDNKLENITITEQEVSDIICSLDVHKSTGHDGISARLLKEARLEITPSLTTLYNFCLANNRFPNEWKKSNVLPLFKNGTKDICSNYRPVSILPVISKIFERIVFKHVYNFFHRHKLITCHQSGFRPNDSTVNQLAYLYHIFCEAIDIKKDIRIVFCDISKAFDRVWHKGLLYKLSTLGINGNLLSFFSNYLSGRQQRVIIKGQCSPWGRIKVGVPQGSVLGPLLVWLLLLRVI